MIGKSLRKLRDRLPVHRARLPLPAGMAVVIRETQDDDLYGAPTLATVLLSYWSSANLTTVYLEQKLAALALMLPGEESRNLERLRPLASLAALPQRAATRVILPALQAPLPDARTLATSPVRVLRGGVRRVGGSLGGWWTAEEVVIEDAAGFSLASARTPVLWIASGYLYTVSFTAIRVHDVSERMRVYVRGKL